MNKAVSIALFGGGYDKYLPSFAQAHLNLFPPSEGWRLIIHVDQVSPFFYNVVAAGRMQLSLMRPANLCKSMLWRMAPLFGDDGVSYEEYVFCRDIDSLPTPRDRAACDEFIASGCNVHTIHDAPVHRGIMGGLCGFHTPSIREVTGWKSLNDIYDEAGDVDWTRHGTDQIVLNKLLIGREGVRVHRTKSPPYTGDPADSLIPFMGAASYDTQAARRFYDEHGDPEIAQLISKCEL